MRQFKKQRLFDLLDRGAQTSIEGRVDQLERQNDVLRELLLELLVEVEALRSVAVDEAQRDGDPKRSEYGRAYREAALLKHNAAGVIPGPVKLAGLFADDEPHFGELPLLRRLGYDEDDLDEYRAKADLVATYT